MCIRDRLCGVRYCQTALSYAVSGTAMRPVLWLCCYALSGTGVRLFLCLAMRYGPPYAFAMRCP
eukprot:745285-Rhodomonas_salina.1